MENTAQPQLDEQRRRDNFAIMLDRNKGRIFYEVILPSDPQPTTIEQNLTFEAAMTAAESGLHTIIKAIIPFDCAVNLPNGTIIRHEISIRFDELYSKPADQREKYLIERLLEDALNRLVS